MLYSFCERSKFSKEVRNSLLETLHGLDGNKLIEHHGHVPKKTSALWSMKLHTQTFILLAEVPAVSLTGWRFGTQRPRFFSVDYRPTEAHSRDLRTGHLRFLFGEHYTSISLRCHFHTEKPGYSILVCCLLDYGHL